MIKSRKGQEGFTLIELLVVVLIIGILAAIAIPAFLGQKKGAQDSNAKSLLRNAAIAMESYYSEHQDFDFIGNSSATTPTIPGELATIEPNISWQTAAANNAAKDDQVVVAVNGTFNAYSLNTLSQSGDAFAWARDSNAQTAKCKAATAAPVGTAAAACGSGVATW